MTRVYIDFYVENNNKDPTSKVGNHVGISKYKNNFAKSLTPNWSEKVFVMNRVKSTVLWIYVIEALNGEEIGGTLFEKELQRAKQKDFKIAKVIEKKCDKCVC